MSAKKSFFCATIIRKVTVGISGLGLCGFVLMHMLGNLLIFLGPEAYNHYSYVLISNPLLPIAEIGLLGLFFGHVILAVGLTLRNRCARPQRYAVAANGEKGTSLIQKSLIAQGIVILVFVVWHLLTFKYGPHYEVTYNGVVMRDLYRLVLEVFQSPLYVFGYVFAVTLLLFHLTHGFASSLQTLGFNHPKYNCFVKRLSVGFGLLVGLGFIAQPLYVFIFHPG